MTAVAIGNHLDIYFLEKQNDFSPNTVRSIVLLLLKLCENWKVVVHFHFALPKEEVRSLLRSGTWKEKEFDEIFYDTDKFELAKSNIWMKKCGDEFTVKRFNKDVSRDVISQLSVELSQLKSIGLEYFETSTKSIDSAKEWINGADVREFVTLHTTRYYTSLENNLGVYIDVTKLAENNFYVVGSLTFSELDKKISLDNLPWIEKAIFPVHSKILEYLSLYNTNLYVDLSNNITRRNELDYTSTYEINHFGFEEDITNDVVFAKRSEEEQEKIDRLFSELEITLQDVKLDIEKDARESGVSLLTFLMSMKDFSKKGGNILLS